MPSYVPDNGKIIYHQAPAEILINEQKIKR